MARKVTKPALRKQRALTRARRTVLLIATRKGACVGA